MVSSVNSFVDLILCSPDREDVQSIIMVKSVLGEEAQLKLTEDRLAQSALPAQVGLVIGKLSSTLDRGFVFDLVATPPNDAGEPPCSLLESVRDDRKKGSKGKSQADSSSSSSSLAIDTDWVSEHARQVSRMLLGGMKVIGVYVWVSDSSFKNSTIILCQTVKGVAQVASLSETDERLLIHISYSPRRWTCRNCIVSSHMTSSSLRPCDFKMGRVLNFLQMYRCIYNFDIRLPIYLENASKVRTMSDILRDGLSVHAKELKGARAMIDGNLVVEEEPCTSEGLHEVEFLLPFMKDTFAEACSQKDVVGVLVFSGSVCSFAFLNSKEPISQVLADIRDDISVSLQSRLDIICDEADGEKDPTLDGGKDRSSDITSGKPVSQLVLHSLRKQCNLSFPRRVFVPWLSGTFICDYLQQAETFEVLKDRCVELMSMEAPTDASTILELETEAPTLVTKTFWDVANPFCPAYDSDSAPLMKSSPDKMKHGSTQEIKPIDLSIKTAILFLLISIFVGLALIFIRAS